MWLDKNQKPYLATAAEAEFYISCYGYMMHHIQEVSGWDDNSTTSQIIDILPPREKICLLTRTVTGLLCRDSRPPPYTLGNALGTYCLFSALYLCITLEWDMHQEGPDAIVGKRERLVKVFENKFGGKLNLPMGASEEAWVAILDLAFIHLLPNGIDVLLDNEFSSARTSKFWKNQKRRNPDFFSDVKVMHIGDFYYVVPETECTAQDLKYAFYCEEIISYYQESLTHEPIKKVEYNITDYQEEFKSILCLMHECQPKWQQAMKIVEQKRKVLRKACADRNMDETRLLKLREELEEADNIQKEIYGKLMKDGITCFEIMWMFSGNISWRAKWKTLGGQSNDCGKRLSVFLSREVQALLEKEEENGFPDMRSFKCSYYQDPETYWQELSEIENWKKFRKNELRTEEEKQINRKKVMKRLDKYWAKIYEECATCQRRYDLHACSACKVVFYCSTVCQKRDWKQHKKMCGKVPKKPATRDRVND